MAKSQGKPDVREPKQDPDFIEFQKYVWGRMPVRKYLCGHNRIFDVVAVAVQEWPEEDICHSQSGDTLEVASLHSLAASCKRHLALVYGEPQWDEWATTMGPVIYQVLWIILQWYRQKPDSVRSLGKWKWNWCYKNKGK